MKISQYVVEVLKTESNDFSKISERMGKERNIRLLHASMGLSTEIGELFEMLQKPKLNLVNLQEECSDCFWYIGVAMDELKISPESFMEKALKKHKKPTLLQKLFVKNTMTKIVCEANIAASMMLDLMKKGVFYGPKPGKPEIDLIKMEDLMVEVMTQMINLLSLGNFEAEKAMDVNIAKLQKKRFKTGKFTENEAHNRNLEEENKILSGQEK